MKTILITFSVVTAILLLHWAYVDFRFRYREGILWFWLLNPAPPMMWIARGLMVAAVIFALCMYFIGANTTFMIILGGLLLLHFISLILLEVLEPR